jgi:tetratricopeptide (TPR) repeat protein
MTELLVKALTKILFLKEQKQYDEAQKEIEHEGKTIIGIDIKMIDMLNMHDIMMLMRSNEDSAGRFVITAELLNQYADIYDIKDNPAKADECRQKSLRLFAEAILTKQLPEPSVYSERLNEMLAAMEEHGVEPAPEVKERLIACYELSGNYAKAEDLIFELIEEGYPGIRESALSFYRKLLLKQDEELIKGNLSREEVIQSMEEISAKND